MWITLSHTSQMTETCFVLHVSEFVGTHLKMCLLSMFGTFRDCCWSEGVATGLQSLALSLPHTTALALRSNGCSEVLLEGGTDITIGGVVLCSCFTEGTASSLRPSASAIVGEGTVRPARWG
jgi:hypothetical protein